MKSNINNISETIIISNDFIYFQTFPISYLYDLGFQSFHDTSFKEVEPVKPVAVGKQDDDKDCST
jgi:hypothetical protein